MEHSRAMHFSRFGISSADLLGSGGESDVYALDHARVVRFYKPGVAPAYVEQRHALYARLQHRQPPFELPRILERGTLADRIYTVERRMRGSVFAEVLPTLRGARRRRALTSYLDVATQIGTFRFPDRPFGELLVPGHPLQRDSWPQFVWDRLQQTFRSSRPDVEQDVPGVDMVLAYLHAELGALEGFGAKALVHGDYFPGNVYIDEHDAICGVGDFSYATVVGDPRLDLAGAVSYVELVDGYQPADTHFLRDIVAQRHGADLLRWLDLYRLYCSFYFSGCKADDPRTYDWCIGNLVAWLEAHGPSDQRFGRGEHAQG